MTELWVLNAYETEGSERLRCSIRLPKRPSFVDGDGLGEYPVETPEQFEEVGIETSSGLAYTVEWVANI